MGVLKDREGGQVIVVCPIGTVPYGYCTFHRTVPWYCTLPLVLLPPTVRRWPAKATTSDDKGQSDVREGSRVRPSVF